MRKVNVQIIKNNYPNSTQPLINDYHRFFVQHFINSPSLKLKNTLSTKSQENLLLDQIYQLYRTYVSSEKILETDYRLPQIVLPLMYSKYLSTAHVTTYFH